ncbi:hypothetical protein QYM36_008069 [Artemia franciscana]|uniref:Uncharacterized protein n=1 Tax=Artemia franciscana TaxID=6661 RepID=A0AA88LED0_ARTSF|nr:hypothetical protein QYM36_008069 [Artemia franciscana]
MILYHTSTLFNPRCKWDLKDTTPSDTKVVIPKSGKNNPIENQPFIILLPVVGKVSQAKTGLHFGEDPNSPEHPKRILARVYVSEKGYVIREDPVTVVNAFQTLTGLAEDEKTNTSRNFEERLDGKSLGRLLLSAVTKSGLDMTKYVGQGYDKAASMSSLVNGAAGEIKRSYQLVIQF